MKLTDNQKKALWITAAVLVLIHFAPRFLNVLHQATTHASINKPTPEHRVIAPPPPTPPLQTPAQIESAQFGKLVGTWSGTAVRSDGDFCEMRLELTSTPSAAGDYTGYSSRICSPIPFAPGTVTGKTLSAKIVKELTPVTTILSGPFEKGAIHLKLDQTLAVGPDGCHPTEFLLRPFGAADLAVQWNEGTCLGGSLNMKRSR